MYGCTDRRMDEKGNFLVFLLARSIVDAARKIVDNIECEFIYC